MINIFLFRVSALEELLDKNEKEYKENADKLMADMEELRENYVKTNEEKDILKSQCEALRSEIVKIEMHNRQAVDLVNNRKQFAPNESGTTRNIFIFYSFFTITRTSGTH